MFASVVTTLEAIAVPAVRPSSSSSSASARTALPAVNPVPVIRPLEVIAPVDTIVEPVVNAPATSTTPEKSPVAASNSPEIVMLRPPVMSMFASVVTTLEAIAVPRVTPSL